MKRLYAFYSLLFALTILLPYTTLAQVPEEAQWVLQRDDDGIAVFTRPQKDNPIDEFKGVVTITGNIDSAFALLCDTKRVAAQDQYVKYAEVLEHISENEFYAYEIISTPFFMKDRDIVMHVYTSKTNSGYFMKTIGEPDHIPLKEGLVRQRGVFILVSFRAIDKNTFEMVYKGSVSEEGGELVTAFANKAIIGSTFERMVMMRKTFSAPATASSVTKP